LPAKAWDSRTAELTATLTRCMFSSCASTNAEVAKRLAELEMKTESLELSHDTFSRNSWEQLRQLLDAVRELTTRPDPPKRLIGFVMHEGKPKGGKATQRKKT